MATEPVRKLEISGDVIVTLVCRAVPVCGTGALPLPRKLVPGTYVAMPVCGPTARVREPVGQEATPLSTPPVQRGVIALSAVNATMPSLTTVVDETAA